MCIRDSLTSDAIVPFKWENTDYILSGAAVGDRGLIGVAMPLPQKFSETVKQLDASQQRYCELTRQRRLLRRTYMELLLLLTVLVLSLIHISEPTRQAEISYAVF